MRGEVVKFSRNERKGSIILQEKQISKAQLPQISSHRIQQTPGLNGPITISPSPSTTSTNQTPDKKVVYNRDQCCHSTSSSTPSAIITSSNPLHHIAQSSTAKFSHSLHLLLPILPLNNLLIPLPPAQRLLNQPIPLMHPLQILLLIHPRHTAQQYNEHDREKHLPENVIDGKVAEKDDAADEEEEDEEVRLKVLTETPGAVMRLVIFVFGRAVGLLCDGHGDGGLGDDIRSIWFGLMTWFDLIDFSTYIPSK
jgi:hypothetical protein